MEPINQYIHPADGVTGQMLDREAVIILPQHGQIKVLNEVGAHIWSLVDGTRTIHQVAAAVATVYAVEPGDAEADTLAFVGDLARRGMVTLERQPAR